MERILYTLLSLGVLIYANIHYSELDTKDIVWWMGAVIYFRVMATDCQLRLKGKP